MLCLVSACLNDFGLYVISISRLLVNWWISELVDWWIGGLVDWWIGGLLDW